MFYNSLIYFCYYYNLVVNGVYSFYRELLDRITLPPPPVFVYKVIKFTEPEGEIETDPEDLTDAYIRGLPILVQPDKTRAEYRVTWKRNKTYRIVRSDPSDPSPNHEMFAGILPDPRKRIVMAVLNNPVDNISEDVMNRVLKFAGPRHDFFGNKRLRMRWLFENDDVLPESQLHLLYTDGKLLKFRPDDLLI